MGFRRVPTDEISTSTTSPGFMNSGGVRLTPTPPGVPEMMTSPAESGVNVEQVLDEFGHREDHQTGARLLDDLTVEPGGQLERLGIGDLVGRDEPGSERARPRKILAGRELRRVALPVAHGDVVVAGVPRDMPQRLGARDPAPPVPMTTASSPSKSTSVDSDGIHAACPCATWLSANRRNTAG